MARVSASRNDGGASNAGHVRVYNWNGTAWNQVGLDIDGEAESDGSGYSASMSSDGNVVAIGAARNDGTGTDAGHVRVYNAFTAKISGNAGFRMMASPVAGQVLGELLTNAWTCLLYTSDAADE